MENKPFHILLCDDSSTVRRLFKEAFDDLDFSVHLSIVESGEELMQWLTNKLPELPDALFIELVIPRKNGFECLEEIVSNESLKQLPVIIYGPARFEIYADMFYKNGAHHYFQRPESIEELKKNLHTILTPLSEKKSKHPAKKNVLLLV